MHTAKIILSPYKPEVLDHIGWHSVLNLVVSQRGSALVGSIQSQWAMATLGMMRRYHGRAVTLCSLRPGWRTGHFYAPNDAAYFGENCEQTFPACTKSVSNYSALRADTLGLATPATWQV